LAAVPWMSRQTVCVYTTSHEPMAQEAIL